MVVTIRGHEEMFFEFGKQAHRDDCTVTVLRALDPMNATHSSFMMTNAEQEDAEAAATENLMLEVARKEGHAEHDLVLPRNIYQSGKRNLSLRFCHQ